jgi:hypothetical protein
MFRTTLVNLSPDAACTDTASGRNYLGELFDHEVIALLTNFQALDSIQNIECDPEIILEMRRSKHVVRTGQSRLYLYDGRDLLAPALVLTPEEIIAEIDGSAAASRTRAPFPLPPVDSPTDENLFQPSLPPPTSPLRGIHRATLATVALGLAGYLAYPAMSAESVPSTGQPEILTDVQQVEAERTRWAGVYMAGTQPGQHGISLAADGTMKLFELNAQGAPHLLQDTFRPSLIDGKLCAMGRQTNEPIYFVGPGTLRFGGETFLKIK